VRASIQASLRDGEGLPPAGDEASVLAENEHERERIGSRVRSVDKRFEGYVEAAAKGRLTREKLHKLSVAAATERLRLEDTLELVERRIGDHLQAPDRKHARESDIQRLVEAWETMRFVDRQNVLRDGVTRVTVTDDRVDVTLRP